MKKLAALAVVPLFAGYLCAQPEQPAQSQESQETTTVTTTTLNGTLIDAGCRNTHMEHKESNSTENSTTKTETTRDTTDCPVNAQTTSFGLLTSDGKFVRFDDAGNTRVIEMMKSNKNWTSYMNDHKPIKVKVVGSHKGDVVVVREIK